MGVDEKSMEGGKRPLLRNWAAPWVRRYERAWLSRDVIAGLTTTAVVIPQAMAYSTIAGLPLQVGLYCGLVPMFVYALMGTSRPLSVSTTSTLSILTAAAIASSASAAEPVKVASTLAVLTGGLLVCAGLLRCGFLADFISKPVLSGFKIGMGLTIIAGQLGNVLGISVSGDGFFEKVASALSGLPESSAATVTCAAITVVVLVAIKRLIPSVPGPLVVLIGGIVAVALFGLEDAGVATAPQVPTGLPAPALPDLTMTGALLGPAAGIALMAFTESIAASRAFRRRNDARVDADRELVALGAAGLLGGIFKAYPAGGGLSQTAVNDGAGARTQFSSVATGACVALTLLVLAPVFSDLPEATLGGIVIVAAVGLLDRSAIKALRAWSLVDYVLALIAGAAVLTLGTLPGVLVGVIASLLAVLWQINHPPVYRLGRRPGTPLFRDLDRHQDDESVDGLVAIRIESRLYFANVRRVLDRVEALISSTEPQPLVVVLDAAAVSDTDATAAEAIVEFREGLVQRGITLWFVGIGQVPRDILRRTGDWERLAAEGRMYPTLDDAIAAFAALDAPQSERLE